MISRRLLRLHNFHKHLNTLRYCTAIKTKPIRTLPDGPNLKEFISSQQLPVQFEETPLIPYLRPTDYHGNNRKVHFEVYGCQMNVNDTEVVWGILNSNGFQKTDDVKEADVILVITCAIREGAETKVSVFL